MKAHLLFADRDFDFAADLQPLHDDVIRDLELAGVLRAMARGDRVLLDVSSKVLMASLSDVGEVLYRQDVLKDCIEHEEMVRELYALVVAALEDKRGIWSIRSTTSSITLHGAVAQLEAFFARLQTLRRLADEHVEQVRSEGMRNLFSSLREDLDDDYLETLRGHLRRLQFRDGVLLSARLDRDNTGVDYVLRSPGTRRTGWRERVHLAPRTSYSFTIPPRDDAGMNDLAELTSRGLNHVANAAAQAADHIESYFTMLRSELAFYVSCLNLRSTLLERETPLVFPVPLASSPVRFSCAELFDMSLVLHTSGPVVGNSVEADDRPLVVITGANSGGKTTFLRSVGLAQLMLQCGMYVAASSYRASLHSGVLTHFGREEDATMRSGRLDDELRRLDLIVDGTARHSLVLFNESFAGTNEREGSEIGRQVVRALLERDVSVFFVTHQFDLADGFRRSRPATTRFLRAERAPDGWPSYKLIPAEPLPTSFAVDVYRRIGGFGIGGFGTAPESLEGARRRTVEEGTSAPAEPGASRSENGGAARDRPRRTSPP